MNFELLAMFIPVIIIVGVMKYYFHNTITPGEAAIQFCVSALLVFGVYQIGLKSRMADTQFLNGVVTSKSKDWTSCEHSYECNCTTDSKGNRSCSTCYEHSNDWDWNVYTNANKMSFTVERIDSRGSYAPPRWTQVMVGEPVAMEGSFDNYVLAAPDSLFHSIPGVKKMPAYPQGYDYSRADRLVLDGVTVPDAALWNAQLSQMLSTVGPAKQANVVVVVTDYPSPDYADALKTSWLGGKKNDVVVVVGAPQYPKIAWVDVFSWSKRELLNVSLRNDISELKTINRDAVIGTISKNVTAYFERRPMAEYEYLKDEITPTPAFLVFGWILAFALPLGIGWFCHRNDNLTPRRRFNGRVNWNY